jgi:hypothetical protein
MKRVTVAMAVIAVCTMIAASASAEANLALRGIGLKGGIVNPEDVGSTLGLGLVLDMGTLHKNVAFESYAGYWSQTDEGFGAEYGVRDFSFGSKAKYMFATSDPTVQPYAGAGLGIHVLNAHAETSAFSFGGQTIPGYSASDTYVKLGMDIGGGIQIDRGNQFAFLADAWYTISDVSYFSLMVGGVYMFGR